MKKTILAYSAAVTMLMSCGDNKKSSSDTGSSKETTSITDDESENKSATFNIDGTEFKGKVTTQQFVNEGFSVLCQQNEPFTLIQAVFANEKEANGTATLKPSASFYGVADGYVNIALTGEDEKFNTSDKSTGTISVDGKKLILKDLKLFNSDKKEKVVNATIAF